MGMVARAAAAFQQLFGPHAEAAAEKTGVIQRRRVFTPAALARTFVLGFLQKPDARDEDLAQLAAQAGAPVTPQVIAQRHTPRLVAFLEELFRRGVGEVVRADRALAPVLDRFAAVVLLDSTGIRLPDDYQDRFPGCGGRAGFGKAALKLQTELDLKTGALVHVGIEPGKSPDGASARQHVRRGANTLRVTDLGYFSAGVFAALVGAGEHFLSRLQPGTGVFLPDGTGVDLLGWLAAQPGPVVDRPILLGATDRLACRLIAWRVPAAQADRRREKLREAHRRKYDRDPTPARLAWCDWTILVTSVPVGTLTPAEAAVLYRARWQVELLFKRWKSRDRVAELGGSDPVRQMVRVWARLLAAVVRPWVVAATAWADPTRSWAKVGEAVRSFVGRLAAAREDVGIVVGVLEDLARVVARTCRRDRRSKPGTVELLNDPSRLDYGLA